MGSLQLQNSLSLPDKQHFAVVLLMPEVWLAFLSSPRKGSHQPSHTQSPGDQPRALPRAGGCRHLGACQADIAGLLLVGLLEQGDVHKDTENAGGEGHEMPSACFPTAHVEGSCCSVDLGDLVIFWRFLSSAWPEEPGCALCAWARGEPPWLQACESRQPFRGHEQSPASPQLQPIS